MIVEYGRADNCTEFLSGYCVMRKLLESRNLKEDISFNIQRAEVIRARHFSVNF